MPPLPAPGLAGSPPDPASTAPLLPARGTPLSPPPAAGWWAGPADAGGAFLWGGGRGRGLSPAASAAAAAGARPAVPAPAGPFNSSSRPGQVRRCVAVRLRAAAGAPYAPPAGLQSRLPAGRPHRTAPAAAAAAVPGTWRLREPVRKGNAGSGRRAARAAPRPGLRAPGATCSAGSGWVPGGKAGEGLAPRGGRTPVGSGPARCVARGGG